MRKYVRVTIKAGAFGPRRLKKWARVLSETDLFLMLHFCDKEGEEESRIEKGTVIEVHHLVDRHLIEWLDRAIMNNTYGELEVA